MSTKSRQMIHGGQIIGAKIRAESARKRAAAAAREADRAEAEACRSKWKHMADRRNHRGQSRNASMAGTEQADDRFLFRGDAVEVAHQR